MKTLCLSCFVGYRRSILYTFKISFHRFHSSFIFLMCPHLMCFSPIQKYLISCFHFLKITCTCVTLHSHENSEISLSSSHAEMCGKLRKLAESPCCLYMRVLTSQHTCSWRRCHAVEWGTCPDPKGVEEPCSLEEVLAWKAGKANLSR